MNPARQGCEDMPLTKEVEWDRMGSELEKVRVAERKPAEWGRNAVNREVFGGNVGYLPLMDSIPSFSVCVKHNFLKGGSKL